MKNSFYNFKHKIIFVLLIMFLVSVNINAQNYWQGTINNDWRTVNNWSDAKVPDKNTDVIIESSCTYYPNINNTGDSCKSILVKTGSTLNLSNSGDLKVLGDVTINGQLYGDDGSFYITGNLILNSGASLTINNCNILCSDAILDINSTVTYSGTNTSIKNWNYGNLVLNGTGIMQITGDAVKPTICNNLTVNNTGNILCVSENKALTINGNLTNNSGATGIVIESGPFGDGSLISSTPNIEATVKRYITGNRWHYLSAPIDSASLTLFNANNFMWWDASVEWTGAGDYSPWKGLTDANLQNAVGYAYYNIEDTIKYIGNMNVSNYSVILHKSATGSEDNQGWNLVGNPYTSVFDWDAAVAGGLVPVGAEDAIYFFDDDGSGSQSNYKYYVPSTGGTYGVGTADANGKIPLGQAFFIKTNTDNVSLSFNSSYRTHNAQEFYKNKTSEIIKLSITGNQKTDEMIYRIVPEATVGYDSHFDAKKLFDGQEDIPQIYSYSNEENQKIAINSIPRINDDTNINIGFKAVAGNYTLNIDELSIPGNEIYLYDNLLKNYIDINKNKKYNFEHFGGEDNERFTLLFEKDLTDTDEINIKKSVIYPNPVKDVLTVNINNVKFPKGTIKIISLTGQTYYSSEFNDNIVKIDVKQLPSGICFLKLYNGNFIETQKFMINK